MSTRKKITAGLFGFGVVGEGIYNLIAATPTLNASVKKICIKHPEKQRNAPVSLFTTNADELLNDPDINLIVELIDNAEDALSITIKAMKNGKSVVSANKKMIAQNLADLLTIRDENKVSFLYEAAVCGSIPVIRNLEEYYDNDLLQSFAGIVNGSTNYILTQMTEKQLPFDTALKQAQEKGFAESDPTLDIEGIDAINKLTILLKHTYGLNPLPKDIFGTGITRIHGQDVRFANEKGFKIKLVANAYHTENEKVAAYVLPTFVNRQSKLYFISNEYNGVVLGSKLADEQFLYGKGAGRYPTASAVLSDISALQYDYNYEYRKSKLGTTYKLAEDTPVKVYVSYPTDKSVEAALFKKIEEQYSNAYRNHIIGWITLEELKNISWISDRDYSLIAFEQNEKTELFHE